MEQYREKLRITTIITAVACIALAAFTLLGFAAEAGWVSLTPISGDSHWHSCWRGFISGASFGILALMIFGLIRNIRALMDEKKLKKFYVKEHDERQIQIYTAARAAATQTFLLVGIVAGIIAGYFSMSVGITIIACVFIHSLIAMGFKIYYSKKF